MTVTKERRQACVFPSSTPPSDTESLHLPTPSTTDIDSDTESIVSSSSPAVCKPVFKGLCFTRKNLGRRKQRRLFNQLRILEEETENVDYVQLMDDYKSPFARILEDENALKQWDDFIKLPEDQQQQLTEYVPRIQQRTQSEAKVEDHQPKISARIRRAMKVKKNLEMNMVEKLECEVIDYFTCFPQGVFISSPPSSFERLLIHAIANYHHLKSISIIDIAIRSVEVTCNHEVWKPMEVSFCNLAKELSQ